LSSTMAVMMYATRMRLATPTAVKAEYVALLFHKYFNDPKYEVIGRIPRETVKNTSFASCPLDAASSVNFPAATCSLIFLA